MTDTDESWTGGPSCSECPRSDCICAALERVRLDERRLCEEAASKAPVSELLPMFEPTPENKEIWEAAINIGVLNAVQAIRSDGGNGCDHEWIDARNSVIESGEVCLKCNSIRPTPESEGE